MSEALEDTQSTGTMTRARRRRQRNKEIVLRAASAVMAEKGIDASTVQEIADRADVSLGTVYNYFESKDKLAVAVMERVMERLAQRIKAVTDTFEDPAHIYPFGCYNVILTATTDQRWRWLLRRSEVISEAMFRVMGRYAMYDIKLAVEAGRFQVQDIALAWRQTVWGLVGISLAICDGILKPDSVDEALVNILGLVGVSRQEAWEIIQRPRPPLPPE